jgi:hypothetical protein
MQIYTKYYNFQIEHIISYLPHLAAFRRNLPHQAPIMSCTCRIYVQSAAPAAILGA